MATSRSDTNAIKPEIKASRLSPPLPHLSSDRQLPFLYSLKHEPTPETIVAIATAIYCSISQPKETKTWGTVARIESISRSVNE